MEASRTVIRPVSRLQADYLVGPTRQADARSEISAASFRRFPAFAHLIHPTP